MTPATLYVTLMAGIAISAVLADTNYPGYKQSIKSVRAMQFALVMTLVAVCFR